MGWEVLFRVRWRPLTHEVRCSRIPVAKLGLGFFDIGWLVPTCMYFVLSHALLSPSLLQRVPQGPRLLGISCGRVGGGRSSGSKAFRKDHKPQPYGFEVVARTVDCIAVHGNYDLVHARVNANHM